MPISALKKSIFSGSFRSLKRRENLIDFTSNDYLGLSRDTTLQHNVIDCWQNWSAVIPQKLGSSGSRLLTGNHRFFEQTEEKIARFHGFSAATLFNCGYMANLALLSSLNTKNNTMIIDLEAHASIHEARKLCKGQTVYFRHNNLNHLEERLKNRDKNCYVVIESLYSMSGDFAPLQEITELCEKYEARLIVDEAHAIGVLGPQGKGLIAEHNLQDKVFACVGAFGKALGVHGAVVLGSHLLQQILFNTARPLIYTTALPLPLLAAIACSYDRFPSMNNERRQIKVLMQHCSLTSPIVPIAIAGNSKVKLASQFLAHKGFDLRPILSPTVATGHEILRLTLHSYNTIFELENCLRLIEQWRVD